MIWTTHEDNGIELKSKIDPHPSEVCSPSYGVGTPLYVECTPFYANDAPISVDPSSTQSMQNALSKHLMAGGSELKTPSR